MAPTRKTPRDWARDKGVSPQLVYYYLRTNPEFKQALVECECGRSVLDIALANKLWDEIHQKKEGKNAQEEDSHV